MIPPVVLIAASVPSVLLRQKLGSMPLYPKQNWTAGKPPSSKIYNLKQATSLKRTQPKPGRKNHFPAFMQQKETALRRLSFCLQKINQQENLCILSSPNVLLIRSIAHCTSGVKHPALCFYFRPACVQSPHLYKKANGRNDMQARGAARRGKLLLRQAPPFPHGWQDTLAKRRLPCKKHSARGPRSASLEINR